MEITQFGSAIDQPDFSKIRIIPLMNGVDASAGATSSSFVFPKAGMKGMILARLTGFSDASFNLTLQQKQNGAWATKPDVPPINTIAADGITRIEFTVNQFTEVRVVVTEDGGGTPVGTYYIDLFV